MTRRKIIKRTLAVLAVALIVLIVSFWDLVSYASRQGYGQLKIIWNAKPVEEFLTDPNFPDSVFGYGRLLIGVHDGDY